MTQNGPYSGRPWPAGGSPGSDEPYTEPADPWGEHPTAAAPEGGWGAHPVSTPTDTGSSTGYPQPYTPAPTGAPTAWPPPGGPQPRRRNAPIIALVVVLGLLICGGLATTAWLISRDTGRKSQSGALATPSAAATGVGVEPRSSEDARFVAKGQCVRNEGSGDSPIMKITPCASGTYEVLKRVDGRTTGEDDAKVKCSKVPRYTKWYFYDSELDSLDFVLCLRER
ncbi:hypothetical protein EV385_2854 [Krasilnikovia cinnamomea]|uniref:Uncharacterized protein n=1 Tax=Krasilnikovia cinnamomea TaxID=349313 RepID=A0A4V2G740_9ACTN|nr:hypothetical protein [Krasilnikovia cinnamomea]RZU51056.1 hypothetical protein EV385_2854 [Krasilnikovia cinnamomea]